MDKQPDELLPPEQQEDNLPQLRDEVGVMAAAARERADIESRLAIAKRFPRDELKAYEHALGSCKRFSFAEKAVYVFPRGTTQVQGPGVKLAREAARCWGNIIAGHRVLSVDDEWIHLQGMAMDLQTNATEVEEHKVRKLIQRKDKRTGRTRWIRIDDERELRELKGRHGAFLERNCILRLLPPYLVDDMQTACFETKRKGAAGDLEMSRDDTLRALVTAFKEFAVSQDMLEAFIECPLPDISADQLATLRSIWHAIKDREAKREDYFEVPKPATETGTVDPDQEAGARVKRIDPDKIEVAPEPEDAARKRERKPKPKQEPKAKAGQQEML